MLDFTESSLKDCSTSGTGANTRRQQVDPPETEGRQVEENKHTESKGITCTIIDSQSESTLL